MAFNSEHVSDGAMIMEGLAQALEVVPDDDLDEDGKTSKAELIEGLRRGARSIWTSVEVGQDFDNAADYSAIEYRNRILFSVFSRERVADLLL